MTSPRPPALPIDALLPEAVAALREGPGLVLLAEPGAGKTTRLPRALLDAGLLAEADCWVLEPRRLAARLAARRVAAELGEEAGGRAGYAVRFEQRVSARTRIRFVTEGLLLRRLQDDPLLAGTRFVLLDEFHERHLETDLALALLRRLQRGPRPDLRIAVLSATLDPDPVAAWLGAPVLRGKGRPHPVAVTHLARPDARPLAQQVAGALAGLVAEGLDGHALVFLPGAAEIRACLRACADLAERAGLRLLPLHGDLPSEAQEEALAPSDRPKVILSTNLAESSVTLEGVTVVLDSGLAREAGHNPWSGLPGLRTVRISRQRTVQRAGRAGRTGPGRCLRLYTEAEERARPEADPPELLRADLAEALLRLHALGLGDPGALDWFEPPPAAALRAARDLLNRLGAVADGALTPTGRRMAALPLHPRLARLVTAGEDLGVPVLARRAAVLLEAGDLRARAGLEARAGQGGALDSDLLPRLDDYQEAADARFGPGALRAAGLDPGAVHRVRRALGSMGGARDAEAGAEAERRLREALLRAYPDRVARRRGDTLALAGGGGAVLDPSSRVRNATLLLALEAEQAGGGQVWVRAASALEPDWLLAGAEVRGELVWNPQRRRAEQVEGLWWDGLCFEEGRRAARAGEPGVADLVQAAAAEADLGPDLDPLLDRAAFLARLRPDLGLPGREGLRERLLDRAASGAADLDALAASDWAGCLREELGPAGLDLLQRLAPEWVQLPSRRVRVDYGGEAPSVASRLQDFLGLAQGPRVGGGSVPLVLHLLAPNRRAVQVTTDLAGFWQRAYRELRPQLSRRYPRHAWPEDPTARG